MNDLIERAAAIDALHMHLMYRMGTDSNKKRLDDWINGVPSAQPEVIRCKDCKEYQTDWETSYPNRHYCATMDSFMPEDGFCNYAERRGE